jgi:hypothetical protein
MVESGVGIITCRDDGSYCEKPLKVCDYIFKVGFIQSISSFLVVTPNIGKAPAHPP